MHDLISIQKLSIQFFSPTLKNFFGLLETVIMFYETKSNIVLSNHFVFLTEKCRGRNSLKLLVFAQPFCKPSTIKDKALALAVPSF